MTYLRLQFCEIGLISVIRDYLCRNFIFKENAAVTGITGEARMG